MTEAWLTAADLAALLDVPVGTIYRWAHEDTWRRTSRRHRPVRYHPADAHASYEARRVDSVASNEA